MLASGCISTRWDWYRTQETPRYLREAADAVWRGRRILVHYQSWRGKSQRELEPLGLVLKAGAWYVAARQEARRKSEPIAWPACLILLLARERSSGLAASTLPTIGRRRQQGSRRTCAGCRHACA